MQQLRALLEVAAFGHVTSFHVTPNFDIEEQLTMINNIKITADGIIEDFLPDDGGTFTLKELQDAVGGWVEFVRLAGERTMVVNEVGHLINLPLNVGATTLAGKTIVGDIAIVSNQYVD
jgi:hypothetical protein